MGVHNFSNPNERTKKFQVDDMWIHEEYERKYQQNDIALLRLSEKSTYTPICMPSIYELFDHGDKGIVVGWGRTEAKEASDVVRKAELNIWKNSECEGTFSSDYPVGTNTSNLLWRKKIHCLPTTRFRNFCTKQQKNLNRIVKEGGWYFEQYRSLVHVPQNCSTFKDLWSFQKNHKTTQTETLKSKVCIGKQALRKFSLPILLLSHIERHSSLEICS